MCTHTHTHRNTHTHTRPYTLRSGCRILCTAKETASHESLELHSGLGQSQRLLTSLLTNWASILLTDQSPAGVFWFCVVFIVLPTTLTQGHPRTADWPVTSWCIWVWVLFFIVLSTTLRQDLTDQSPAGVFGFCVVFIVLSTTLTQGHPRIAKWPVTSWCIWVCVVFIVLSTIFTQGHPRTADWPEHWEYSQMFVIGPPNTHTHTHPSGVLLAILIINLYGLTAPH